MPTAPTRVCPRGHVSPASGKCPVCTAARNRARGPKAARGYDGVWDRLRLRYRAAHPLCEQCRARGLVRPMVDVDHIIPFTSVDDPRRLDPLNLQALCRECHRAKTRGEHTRGLA